MDGRTSEISRRIGRVNVHLTHLNLEQQGNIGSHSVLTNHLSEHGKGHEPFDVIIGYACAGRPVPLAKDKTWPKLGDVVLVGMAAYRDIGKVLPIRTTLPVSTHITNWPSAGECVCCPVEAVFLQKNKFPNRLDPYRLPAGATALPIIGNIGRRSFSTGRTDNPNFKYPKRTMLHVDGVAFTTDKVMTAPPAIPVQRHDSEGNLKEFDSYGESLQRLMDEPDLRGPVVVDMEAFGMFSAATRLAGQTYLLRVLTDDCAGKNEKTKGKDGNSLDPDAVQQAYLEYATPTLNALLRAITSRKPMTVAVVYLRMFAARARHEMQLANITLGNQQLDETVTLVARIGNEVTWKLALSGMVSPLQAYILMQAKTYWLTQREDSTITENERQLALVRIAEVARVAWDELGGRGRKRRRLRPVDNVTAEDLIEAERDLTTLTTIFHDPEFPHQRTVTEQSLLLEQSFRDLKVQDAMAHALFVPQDRLDFTEDERETAEARARIFAEHLRSLNR